MLGLYQKMYAVLTGRIDTAIIELAGIASHETCDRQRVLAVAEDLRQALLKTEDMYLNAEEEN